MNRNKDVQKQFYNMIKTHGWAAHYVPLDDFHINYHTHGLKENYNHRDLQIVLPVSMENAHGIVSGIIHDIKEGKVFYEDIDYIGYLGSNHRIQFKEFYECERPVLRILFPDKKGRMPFDVKCDAGFKAQLDILED
ncbi:hypothetical protein D3C78_1392550 [compost metagenome]